MGRAPAEVRAAYLVEAYRDEKGRPRQRQHYLAQAGLALGIGARVGFWDRTAEVLDGLALTPAERRRIEGELVAVVPRPTTRERREREAFLAGIAQELQAIKRDRPARVVPRKRTRASISAALQRRAKARP